MHYIVYGKDKPNHLNKRLENYDAHKAYLGSNPINFLMSGPIVDESDHETMIGSFFLVEADNIEQVKEFNRNDPFYKADIWESVHIEAFSKRVDNISAK
jgi:hypothetical protein